MKLSKFNKESLIIKERELYLSSLRSYLDKRKPGATAKDIDHTVKRKPTLEELDQMLY